MVFYALFVICLLLSVSQGTVRNTDKQASAYCQYNELEGSLDVQFNVKLNTDPQGRLTALVNSAYYSSPKLYTAVNPCSITYDATNKVYSVVTKRDRVSSDNINRDSNLCGLTEKTENGQMIYELLFLHQIYTNNFDMIDDKDRVYIVRCTNDNTASNMAKTSVTVQTPNLPVSVAISSLPVTLSVWLKNTADNTYSRVTTKAVAAGSTVRLQLELDRGANYIDGLNVYGINTFLTEVSDTDAFNKDDYLVDSNGCRYGGTTNAAPFLPTVGFKGAVQTVTGGSRYVLTSGDFTLWKYRSSDTIYFLTYFDICFTQNKDPCTNLCKVKTGQEARKRRQAGSEDRRGIVRRQDGGGERQGIVRRQAGDGEQLGIAFTSVRVTVDTDVVTEEQKPSTSVASKTTTVIIVLGSIVGALVVILLVLAVCLVAFIRRRNKMNKHHTRFENMSIASTTDTSVSKQ